MHICRAAPEAGASLLQSPGFQCGPVIPVPVLPDAATSCVTGSQTTELRQGAKGAPLAATPRGNEALISQSLRATTACQTLHHAGRQRTRPGLCGGR